MERRLCHPPSGTAGQGWRLGAGLELRAEDGWWGLVAGRCGVRWIGVEDLHRSQPGVLVPYAQDRQELDDTAAIVTVSTSRAMVAKDGCSRMVDFWRP